MSRRLVNGQPDLSFHPPSDLGEISHILLLPDGDILIGQKPSYESLSGPRLDPVLRLNHDGSLDPGFDMGPQEIHPPADVFRDRDGAIWTASLYELRKSDADGSPDVRCLANGQVSAVCQGADGSIWAGGSFTMLGAVSRSYLARLNADGSMAAAPPVALDGEVTVLKKQRDGSLLIAGSFRNINGTPREWLARLHADGTLDTSFSPDLNNSVFCIEPQPDGRILIGGAFSSVDGQPQRWLARLNADGSRDPSFVGEVHEYVYDIEIQPDGRILATGVFLKDLGGSTFNTKVGRMSAEGRLESDTVWLRGDLTCAALRPDGTLITGSGQLRLLRADRSVDPAFTHTVNGGINCVGVEPSGAVVFGGLFTQVDGLPRQRLARVDASGSLDPSFMPSLGGSIYCLLRLPDGRWLVGGNFNASGVSGLARLHASGSLDTTFTVNTSGTVMALSSLPDGRLFVGGAFEVLNGQTRNALVRLTAEGAVDAGFAPLIDGYVKAVQALPGGGCLVGGVFSTVNGHPCAGLARLHADGSVDTTFHPVGRMDANDLALRMDGVIQVAGQKQDVETGSWLPELVLLNPDGSVHDDLMPKESNEDLRITAQGAVRYVQTWADGRMDAGGDFAYIRHHVGVSYRDWMSMCRSSSPAGAFQRLGISRGGRVLTWTRRGGLAALENVSFDVRSASGDAWQPLGIGQPLGNGEWAIHGLTLTPGLWQVRATGQIAGGDASWNSLTSWLEVRAGAGSGFDLWLEQRHGLRAGDVDTASERSVDPASGVHDLLAYATGQSASQPGQALDHEMLPQGVSSGTGAAGVSFPNWPARDDLILKVQCTNDLHGPWREIARRSGITAWQESEPGVHVGTEPGDMVHVHESDALLPGTTRFFRISVSVMNP